MNQPVIQDAMTGNILHPEHPKAKAMLSAWSHREQWLSGPFIITKVRDDLFVLQRCPSGDGMPRHVGTFKSVEAAQEHAAQC